MTEAKRKSGEEILTDWSLRAEKMDGGNVVIGPEASTLLMQLIDEAIQADRLAEEKAREALDRLAGEVSAILGMREGYIRSEIGNTNFNRLMDRVRDAREALRLLEGR